MMQNKDVLPYSGAIRFLGVLGATLAIISTLSGIAMLLLKWGTGNAPHLLTHLTLFLLPIAFLALILAMVLMVLQRRSI